MSLAEIETCNQAEFARRLNVSTGYITQLKQSGRLVFARAGLLDVNASLARMKETSAQHSRVNPIVTGPEFNDAKARNEHYQAELSRLKFEAAIGALRETADVAAVVAEVATTLRARLESWPSRLAPQLSTMGGDEARIRAELTDHVYGALTELSHGFARLAQEASLTPAQ